MTLRLADATERDDLGAFTARVVRLDQTAAVRLTAGVGRVTAWARTPFDVLVTRSVAGELDPAVPVTAQASTLLTALAVDRSAAVDPGPPAPWLDELPPDDGWSRVDDVPAAELDELADRGLALAREHAGPMGPPASLLDQTVLTVSPPDQGRPVTVPMRVLFAMSGMGFLGSAPQETDGPRVRVSASGSWIRLDARYGAVVKRRVVSLPLSVAP
ncbi:hypothetical protein Ae406Ps2_2256c [Pseudonocardia sp. Ae406_Ps2]|uniref:hypothetical protein n=1 Tax=unclassified Pseudonocardia TaxID=2619320 RepID=UPI0003073474|nr:MULTISPECIES: hypothetical protein [unclassified Pseudonocardia]OLM02256.1 hypothetical protein Ae406Ps2_2256c [Pseudonocardia sp. Ae406_Ps2]OLM05961.1 hypothetical protein Ae331Ps2_3671 [Pseudonocardia sp. Ae331_Ps2]OLM15388.1 hypothetical protein Ae505Ps2_5520c [Pseudonocardia sp. Ae505_Ps2]OLM23828.1 hypothetical protein Ae706Ps2_2261c [Pseudonocardia sp. Ae706_Ps2]OLM30208.1 hypothetical protein Ae717Ps2_1103 [Pseudonocardia sp. Ae717_Ps2]